MLLGSLLGSFGIVVFIRMHLVGLCVRSGWLVTFACALWVVGLIRGSWVDSGVSSESSG